jgi:hypothetical protein
MQTQTKHSFRNILELYDDKILVNRALIADYNTKCYEHERQNDLDYHKIKLFTDTYLKVTAKFDKYPRFWHFFCSRLDRELPLLRRVEQ